MSATITLSWDEILWYLEGAMSGSHLRWSVYSDMVDIFFPQLNDDEREKIYTYAKRDLSHKVRNDRIENEMFQQFLARYNPSNQYLVVAENNDIRDEAVTYLWKGRYYTNWNRFFATDYIVDVTRLPFLKCNCGACDKKDLCVRHKEYQDGDDTSEIFVGGQRCDFFIEENECYGK